MTSSSVPIEAMQGMLAQMRGLEKPIARDAASLGAHAIVGEAAPHAPVRTGNLQNAHLVDDTSDPDAVLLGIAADYAPAVHERWQPGGPASKNRNPNAKNRWFLATIITHGPRFMKIAIERAVAKHAASIAGGSGGGASGGGSSGGPRRDSRGRFIRGSGS